MTFGAATYHTRAVPTVVVLTVTGVVVFVMVADSFVLIQAVSDGSGGFYLRTRADRTTADNLDSLPISSR